MENYCYLCSEEITNENKHKEHILQNAIGGTLKPDHILCIECGGKLGDDIDVPFVKIFENISSRLRIKKDRDTKKKKLYGSLNGIDISWENFKITPRKPQYTFDEKTKILTIYANKKTANNYKKKLINEIGRENIDKVKIVDDLKGIGSVSFPFELDNTIFKRGFAKIAVGFATYNNVKRSDLSLVIDTKNKAIKDQIAVLPYYPSGPVERFLELTRIGLDYEFPYHSIILFTLPYHPSQGMGDKKMLICFIELFSTFQHYVILSYKYSGANIYESYGQKIFKKEEIQLSNFFDPKSIHIHLAELGLNCNDIDSLNEDELKPFFEKKYNQKKYNFDYNAHINSIISNMLQSSMVLKAGIKDYLTEEANCVMQKFNHYFYENIERLTCLKKNIELYYRINQHDEEIFFPNAFRVYFYNEELEISNNFNGALEAIEDMNMVKEYGHMKFYTLSKHIDDLSNF